MVPTRALTLSLFTLALGVGGIAGACSSSSNNASGGSGNPLDGDGGFITWDASATGLSIDPSSADIVVNPSGPAPAPVQFVLRGAGDREVLWRLTNPALGLLNQSGLFTPGG